MKDIISLYEIAEKEKIPVLDFRLPLTGSMAVRIDNGKCAIGIDEKELDASNAKRVHLAHELGHCVNGAFYNIYASCDVREKHEYTADKWAIKKLIPKDELEVAIARGYTEIWALAEYFGVTEDFMRKAVCLYKNGNLAVDYL